MKKILVVDDDQAILEAISVSLEFENYAVVTADSADSAFHLAQSESPDLIILDVLLSGDDGRDVARRIKGSEVTRMIPIIMVSAHPNVQESVLEAGADHFLAKPFDFDNLLALVASSIH